MQQKESSKESLSTLKTISNKDSVIKVFESQRNNKSVKLETNALPKDQHLDNEEYIDTTNRYSANEQTTTRNLINETTEREPHSKSLSNNSKDDKLLRKNVMSDQGVINN